MVNEYTTAAAPARSQRHREAAEYIKAWKQEKDTHVIDNKDATTTTDRMLIRVPESVKQLDISNHHYTYKTMPPGSGVYVAPGGKGMVVFSVCAKCGSTSAYNAMYSSIYGVPFPIVSGKPYIQTQYMWPKQGRPLGSLFVSNILLQAELAKPDTLLASATIPKIFFQVVRDPVDRYFSTFHSKLKCCDPNTEHPYTSKTRKSCAPDQPNSKQTRAIKGVVGSIRHIAESEMPPGDECLYFDEFATLMETIHRKGRQHSHMFNTHALAQTVNVPLGWTGWVGTIRDLTVAVNGMRLGLHPLNITRSHKTSRNGWQPTEAGLKILCKLAEPEYKELRLDYEDGPCSKREDAPCNIHRLPECKAVDRPWG